MRTLVLALTVLLLAAPVWATVTITAEKDGTNPRKVWIGYESDEAELIRAFALDITVADGNIVEVNDYSVGDDVGGYGIFPGSFAAAPITVNPTTGQVDNWNVAGYSPVAPASDPDAQPGVGSSGVTIEMGSLYDTAAPSATEGILCSVTVDDDVTELCVAANAIRGNVVLESAAEVQNLVMPDCLTWGDICFPTGTGYDRQYADWVASGSPDCWCGAESPTLPPVTGASWLYQCDGDADGGTQVIGWRVYTNDLTALANSWQAKLGAANLNPCADFDHKGQVIGWRVYTNDLTALATNWQKKDGQLGANCPRPE